MVKEDVAASSLDMNRFNNEETLLYNQDSRQRLVNDLEECEYFLRQRLVELSSKDQTQFAMYGGAANEKGKSKECDNVEYVKRAIQQIEKITMLLNHKNTLNLLFIRSKPK